MRDLRTLHGEGPECTEIQPDAHMQRIGALSRDAVIAVIGAAHLERQVSALVGTLKTLGRKAALFETLDPKTLE